MMAVMTAQSVDWRFCQSTGAGLRIFSSRRESNSFFKLCRKRPEGEVSWLNSPLALFWVHPVTYLDQVSDACRGAEDDPLVHGDGLLVLVLLDCDVSSKEQQWERGHLSAIVQEDLRTSRGMMQTHHDGRFQTNTLTRSALHTWPYSHSVVWAESVLLVKSGCASLKCVSVPPVLGEMSCCPVSESRKCVFHQFLSLWQLLIHRCIQKKCW